MMGLFTLSAGRTDICFLVMITLITESSKATKWCTSGDMFESHLELLKTDLGLMLFPSDISKIRFNLKMQSRPS